MVQYVCIYRCLSHGLIDSKLCVFVIIKKLCPAGEEVRDLCPGREGKKTTMRAGTRLFLSSPSSGPDGQGRPKWHFGGPFLLLFLVDRACYSTNKVSSSLLWSSELSFALAFFW
jgi:hypothetical protein